MPIFKKTTMGRTNTVSIENRPKSNLITNPTQKSDWSGLEIGLLVAGIILFLLLLLILGYYFYNRRKKNLNQELQVQLQLQQHNFIFSDSVMIVFMIYRTIQCFHESDVFMLS